MSILELEKLLLAMNFIKNNDSEYTKCYSQVDCNIKIDLKNKKICYPVDKGFIINDNTTTNFDKKENFVVLECVNRLFDKGYRPEHVELEKRWNLGHDSKGGKADICVYDKEHKGMLCIIECKTFGQEYNKELNNTLSDGGQLFSYWQQERSTKWLIIYTSRYENNFIEYKTESINCSDDANILELSKKDVSIEVYKNASTVHELYDVWKETYDKALYGDIIFTEDTQAYNIGIRPLKKKDLIDFETNNKIVNKFEEILRHNNVSDKENAFNRLIALFICKLVDEINKNNDDIVEFQYKNGTDTYESLQDRLQRLHKQGMDEFMKEKIFYVSDDYAEKLVKTYTGANREQMIKNLNNTIRILKFYTNNDFAFKDVHNEELFYQNGKIVVEMVELFQKYRIIGSQSLQLLGDLFEQLLNKGFKQNEGQFFTPVPITRFIWKSLPLEDLIKKDDSIAYPKIIDYACGSGHFLTEGFEQISKITDSLDWAEHKIFGIEKDYRLARVSKISLFMHGAGNGHIIYGDGLENFEDKEIANNSFDILVANPPYSVAGFKPHLKLKNNNFEILDLISKEGSEIETLFVERINQLLKPNSIGAVVLPSSILNKDGNSFIKARESILKHFDIKAIVRLGNKTFGETGTNTIILYLKKYDEPLKREDEIRDSVNAIFSNDDFKNFEDNTIFKEYLNQINVTVEDYYNFINRIIDYKEYLNNSYFKMYVNQFEKSTAYKNKIKQNTFKKISDDDRMSELNTMFYNYVESIEKDKIEYFGYVYKQDTLIVYAPDKTKEQEKFLGYKWSKRKGAEGIQILNGKGLLYTEQNSKLTFGISDLIKDMFTKGYTDKITDEAVKKYCYCQSMRDMINFETINFSKSIKITKIRKLKNDPNYKTYTLADEDSFKLKIGSRVLADDLLADGTIPVYSANVNDVFGYTNKTNIDSYDTDSILWGIDGDWMVNIIPKNNPFYATDHCGVLQLSNKDINPKYMALALEVAGDFEKFSRTNRASTERVSQLKIQIPKMKMQLDVIKHFENVDTQIKEKREKINSILHSINDNFEKTFNLDSYKKTPISELYELQLGCTPPRNNSDYWLDGNKKWISVADMGKYIAYTENTSECITEKAVLESNIKVVPKNTVIMSFKLTIGRTAITSEEIYTNEAIMAFIPKEGTNISNIFLKIYLSKYKWDTDTMDAVKGVTLNKDSIGEAFISIPPKDLQDQFEKVVSSLYKEANDSNNELIKLLEERELLLNKYIR